MHHFSRFLTPFILLAAVLCAAETPTNLTFLSQKLSFEPNVGQTASSARFLSRGPGYAVGLKPTGVTFNVDPTRSIQMNFLGAARSAKLEGQSILPGRVNYFPSPRQIQWHTNIPTYERVAEREIYPGVDLVFYGNHSKFEYDFVIRPNSSVTPLQLTFSGADHSSLDAQGNLVVKTGDRQLSLLKPVAYQFTKDGKSQQPVAASYRLDPESGSISFNIGVYDHTRTLIIDPVLTFSEYLASPVNASAMDQSGNIFVVTGSDALTSAITKLSAAGTVVYTTTFGSGLAPSAVAVDSLGNAYIAGTAFYNSTLPVSANAYSSVAPQNASAFLLKVSANGSSLPYGSYLGGTDSNDSGASSIAVDSSGNAYLAGYTQSATFPTTPGAYQTVNPEFSTAGFVSKFNPTLSGHASLIYSTLIGTAQSSLPPVLNGIAVDASGDAYVTGRAAAGYPVTSGAFQYTGADYLNGGVYITKFNAGATALVYSAYLGYGTGNAIAVDRQGNAYVTGTVQYADFPVTTGAYQTIYPGGFVTKLNPAGSAEVFSTFLGGPSSQEVGFLGTGNVTPASLAITPGCPATTPSLINCNVYVSGTTSTSDFPVINAVQNAWTSVNSSLSAFVTELSSTGQSAQLSTYLSGSGPAGAETTPGPFIAVDAAGDINLTGNLFIGYDVSFPVTVPAPATQSLAFFARVSPGTGAALLPSPGSLSLNSVVGLSSTLLYDTGQITLGNYGTSPITISSVQISPAVFAETNNCGTTLAAGSSCTVSVVFTPTAAVVTTGSITVDSSAKNTPLNIPISGAGFNSDFLQTSAQSLTFGDQVILMSSKSQTFTLRNLGNTAVTPTISVSGDFSVVNNCAQLAAQGSCNITVTFLPSQVGLRSGDVEIYNAPNSLVAGVSLTGSGVVPGVSGSLTATPSSLQFGSALVGSTDTASGTASVKITNTGAVPITVQSIATAGDFQIWGNSCSAPIQLSPLDFCYVFVEFTPTAASTRAGTLTITDSVSSTPQIVPLTGTGLPASQTAEIYPATYLIEPNQPVGTTGPDQPITLQNTGTAPISIYKIVTTGPFRVSSDPCTGTSVAGTNDDGIGVYSFCTVNVNFEPTITGAFAGTLSFYDSAPGSPHIVHLAGTGITATGALTLSTNSLTFPTQGVGTSASQGFAFNNPGDSPVQVTAITATGDFSTSQGSSCSALPFTLLPGGNMYCYWDVNFSPSAVGTRTGTVSVHSSAGVQTISLTGTGVAADYFRQMIPSGSMGFGSQVVGQSGNWQWVYFYHNKPASADPYPTVSVSGADAGDFTVDSDIGCASYNPNVTVCGVWIYFTPSATGTRTAAVTFTDWAGSKILNITGTGLAATPHWSISQSFITFPPPQTQGATSTGTPVTFTNSSAASVSLGNVAVSANFINQHSADTCSGATVPAGQSCTLQVEYAPAIASPAANRTDFGTLTIKNSTGVSLISAALGGYSQTPAYAAVASQNEVNFAQQQALGFTSDYQTYVFLTNTGNTALTIGTLNGTNLGLAGPTAEFSILPANQGSDYCSGTTLQAGAQCFVYVTFTPNVLGTSTGALNFPITYTNNTTATVQVKLSGVGIAISDHALLSPTSVSFADLGVGTTSPASVVTLTNTGNESVTVGVLVGTNTVAGPTMSGEFSTNSTYANDGCSRVTLNPGASCSIHVTLTPSGTGTRSGGISFPLTFLDKNTTTQVLNLTGNGLGAVRQLQISPQPVLFTGAIQGNPNATAQQNVTITNTGDSPVVFGKDAISTNATDYQISYDFCASSTLAAGANCTIVLIFSPSATSTGTRSGVLTIADNAVGGPHAVPLSGNAITASQQIELSQTSVTFGTQQAGTTSLPQMIYITNQGPQEIDVPGLVLGGTNAADFQLTNTCYYLDPSCSFGVIFAPQAGATGTRTATITETDTAPGSPRIIRLTGTVK